MVTFRFVKWAHLSRQFLFALCIGMVSGFAFAYLMLLSAQNQDQWFPFPLSDSDPHSSSQLEGLSGPVQDIGSHAKDEEFHKYEDTSVADTMAKKIKILCWVMTGPQNHEKKARHVKNTWGKRCNILLFMSSKEDKTLPAIALPVKEGRDNLWAKTKEAFKYVYKNHIDEVDWVMKADDDTYVVVENLRYLLSSHNPMDPLYFGCRFKPFVKQGYMSGGAGYVLSKEAVKRFVNQGIPNSTLCSSSNGGAEDVEVGVCLEKVGVKAVDTRDSHGRGRFFPFVPEHHLIPTQNKEFWYWKYIYYESKGGMDCCSDNAISFHYVSPNQMYVLEYLVYHLKPYGISYQVSLPKGFRDTSSQIHQKQLTQQTQQHLTTVKSYTSNNSQP